MPSLDPFQDELFVPTMLAPRFVGEDGTHYYRIEMRRGERRLHSQLPNPTPYWGYNGLYPGPTIEVPRTCKAVVEFVNSLPVPASGADPVSQWPFYIPAEGSSGSMPPFVPKAPWTVVHLHGSPNPPDSDGWPDNAYFPGGSQTHHYPAQESIALLWYHDHANMITRLNVYAGLAGLYIVRDSEAERQLGLPIGIAGGEFPILIQDRELEVVGDAYTGRFAYQKLSRMDPFKGGHRLANGTIAPYLKVSPRRHRFRIINGSNARILQLQLQAEGGTPTTQGMTVIGVDGGLLRTPVPNPTTTPLDSPDDPQEMLVLAPAERVDVLIDFDRYVGKHVVLFDQDYDTLDLVPVMRFDVDSSPPIPALPHPILPERLRSPRSAGQENALVTSSSNRPIGLYHVQVMGMDMHTLNGRLFHDAVEETPEIDTEEIWEILNVTVDEHPIHLHLVNFDVLDRQRFNINVPDRAAYLGQFDSTFRTWKALPPGVRPPLPPGLDPVGSAVPADPYESMFKDTVRVPAFTVTRIHVRFRLRTGTYMYHCHILEHEDMEMMRPLIVAPGGLHLMSTGGHGHGHGGHMAPMADH